MTVEKIRNMVAFDEFYRWDSVKSLSILIQVLVVLIGPFLLGSIIWYERHGGHSGPRTLVNRFVSVICAAHILVYNPTNFAFILGTDIV